MIIFHCKTLGLELSRRFGDDIAFLREWRGHAPARTKLHHFTLEIPREEYERAEG